MLNDIFVCGSSVASGYGKGKIDGKMGNSLKSWVNFLSEYSSAKNVWNVSLPAKPIGLSTVDVVQFVRQYGERYNTYNDLFVIVEYTIPQYRHWDPVAVSRNDTKEIIEVIPTASFRMGKNTDHLTSAGPRDNGASHVGQKFLTRASDEYDMLSPTNACNLYEEIRPSDLDKTFVDDYTHKAKEWLKYDVIDPETYSRQVSEKKMLTFLRYASDEVAFLQRYLTHFNIPYLMFWAGGQTPAFCRTVDRYFTPLMKDNRLIPMSKFSCNRAAIEWSNESWGVHPDEVGHQRIAEFIHDWIKTHKLTTKPNTTIFTGFK